VGLLLVAHDLMLPCFAAIVAFLAPNPFSNDYFKQTRPMIGFFSSKFPYIARNQKWLYKNAIKHTFHSIPALITFFCLPWEL